LDAEQAFVGVPGGNGGTGAVTVFERQATSWRDVGELQPHDDVPGAGFGAALASTGDEVWVGAPGAGGGDGAVYRFRRSVDAGWATLAQLGPDSAETGAWRFGFGGSIAVGSSVSVVGMPTRDFGEGRAAIMTPSGDADWDERATVFGQIVPAVGGIEPYTDCDSGSIAGFPCSNVEVVSFTPVSALGGARGVWVNDVWGWTDPETGRDYALVSRRDGAAFVDLTDPTRPRLVGSLPRTPGARPTVWRDIKVVNHHAYVVSDGAGPHGMQVFDLTRLRSVTDPPVTFTADTLYDRIHSAHNVVADTASGFLYIVGANGGGETCGGGLHIVDARDPKSPVFAGCYNDATGARARGYTHDAQCVVYRGPDTRYTGRQICVGSNESEINIADVTDKAQPVPIGRSGYPNVAYAHQGWFDESQRYFYMNDELDEIGGLVDGTRTLVWDLLELDDPILVKEYIGPVRSSDHNLFIRGNLAYMSNYGSGLRVLDISDPENPQEVAFFDSAPVGDNEPGTSSSASGAWSNYPFFQSGLVVFTSVREGLFVVRVKPEVLIP
jgi:choice-of-anchor B domain-containing protein